MNNENQRTEEMNFEQEKQTGLSGGALAAVIGAAAVVGGGIVAGVGWGKRKLADRKARKEAEKDPNDSEKKPDKK